VRRVSEKSAAAAACPPSTMQQQPVPAVGARSLSVEIWGAEIPAGLLLAAEQTVDTPYACLAYVRAYQPELIPRLQHAVARHCGELVAIVSFYARSRSLVVVNRLLRFPDQVLNACVAAMLEQNPAARSVEFTELYNEERAHAAACSFTWRTIDCVAAELPASYGEYLEHFGAATRKNLRYCARRLERDAPAVSFNIHRREAISASMVAAVVQLNHQRMAFKGGRSGIDESYAARLATLSRSHGVACIATDGAAVVAGALCTEVGSGWTLHVIAHDPQFNHVRLGLLCLLKAVEEAIACGAARFNFLWGLGDYKLLFGGTVSALRARRYYRDSGTRLLALADMRDFTVQSLRRHVSLWRRGLKKRAHGPRPHT
jgi:hypothetical protein